MCITGHIKCPHKHTQYHLVSTLATDRGNSYNTQMWVTRVRNVHIITYHWPTLVRKTKQIHFSYSLKFTLTMADSIEYTPR